MKRNRAWAAVGVIALWVGVPAFADDVRFDYPGAVLDYAATTGVLTVSEEAGNTSALLSTLDSGMTTDLARISGPLGGVFDLDFSLDIVDQGGGVFAASGTLSATDIDTGSAAIEASFQSTLLMLVGGLLRIDGTLSPLQGADSILVNRESSPGQGDWIYAGVPGHTPASPDGDGVLGTISADGVTAFDSGMASIVAFGAQGDLMTFFSRDQRIADMEGTGIIIPEPATLCMLLVGAAALARRRVGVT
jgi:hypothetical protein